VSKRIVMLCSLDTKAELAAYLKDRIEDQGLETTLIDVGYGKLTSMEATITAADVALSAGTTIEEIHEMADTGATSTLMMQGAIIRVQDLLRRGQCDGVVSFGGASNTTLATGVMNTLPTGVPKLMVSSSAAMPAYSARYFGFRDITIMHATVDLSALNDITCGLLDRAAGGICGMAQMSDGPIEYSPDSKLVAVTTFRFAEDCSRAVMTELENLGYSAIPFHAQGVGENAMEAMVSRGLFDGVADVVPAGLSEYLLGGNRAALPERLEGAGRAGVPQVVATSGFDMISCGPIARRDSSDPLWTERDLASRAYSVPDRFRVEARTTADEVRQIAAAVSEKLNSAESPACVMVPTRGWSSLSVEGAELFDPEADSVLAPALRERLDGDVSVIELDLELNTDEFGRALAGRLHSMIEAGRPVGVEDSR